jgi:hypothetical protein
MRRRINTEVIRDIAQLLRSFRQRRLPANICNVDRAVGSPSISVGYVMSCGRDLLAASLTARDPEPTSPA